jgi:hypothetical protein
MYADIQTESAQRISEIREHLHFISSQTPPPPTAVPRYINTEKGLVFVELYGVLEYTILQTLSRTISIINSENIRIDKLKINLWALALDPGLEALNQANTKKWDKRKDIFNAILTNPVVAMDENLLPTDGKNFTRKQLQSIWDAFGISEPLFHDVRFGTRMKDIAMNRINVAHGNLSPSYVGSAFTISDLEDRLNDVSAFCTYLTNTFDDYITRGEFEA